MIFFRFLFLNVYAFLLFALGAIIVILPKEFFYLVVKYLLAVWCIFGGIAIFAKWKAKKQILKIVTLRNRNEIRPDTFKWFRKTLCWKLVINVSLSDLRKTENYRNIPKAEWNDLKRKAYGKTAVGGSKRRKPFQKKLNKSGKGVNL